MKIKLKKHKGYLLLISFLGLSIFSTELNAQKDNNSLEEKINRLTALEDIKFVVKAYALSIDVRNWDLHRKIFTEDYQLFRGSKYKVENIEKRVERLETFTARFESTQNLPLTYSIDLNKEKDSAFVISAVNARHKGKLLKNGKTSKSYLQTGWYHYWLKKTNKGWKIYKMRVFRSKQRDKIFDK